MPYIGYSFYTLGIWDCPLLLNDDKLDLLYSLLEMLDDGNPEFEDSEGPPLWPPPITYDVYWNLGIWLWDLGFAPYSLVTPLTLSLSLQ